MIIIKSHGLKRLENLSLFLDQEYLQYQASDEHLYLAWGRKKSALKSIELAKRNNSKYLTIEDGLIRSLDLGVNNSPSFSMYVDPIGCYIDATAQSALEYELLNQSLKDNELDMAKRAIELIKKFKISKYNNSYAVDEKIKAYINDNKAKGIVLIVDQTLSDASLEYGLYDKSSKIKLLNILKEKYSQSIIVLKQHVDVIAGKKSGVFSKQDFEGFELLHIAENYDPHELIELCDVVFTISSTMGFEALLYNKKVYTLAVPFYSGYNLSIDLNENLTNGKYPNLQQRALIAKKYTKEQMLYALFYILCIKLTRYVNIFKGKRTDIFNILHILHNQKRINQQNRGNFVCVGIKKWKRTFVKSFLQGLDNKIVFINNHQKALEYAKEHKANIVQWASLEDKQFTKQAQGLNLKTLLLEDGFIRSVGLGSNYQLPSSLVVDFNGIYYDPKSKSDLFSLLNNYQECSYKNEQAEYLIDFYKHHKLSKYNVGSNDIQDIKRLLLGKKNIILLPGQVIDDASVLAQNCNIHSNLDLLKYVRNLNPNSFIIYKEHPDVSFYNRKGHDQKEQLLKYADLVIKDINITSLYELVDIVYTLSSQSGFEALIYGKEVYTIGRPFYANWGLTKEPHDLIDRHNTLSLNALVYTVLCEYPRYYDYDKKQFCLADDICYLLMHKSNSYKQNILVKALRALQYLKKYTLDFIAKVK